MTSYDRRHGGPFDRGAADAHYGRPFSPHYFAAGTYTSPRVDRAQMTDDDVRAYAAGYDGWTDRKDWGHDEEADPRTEDEEE